MATCMYVKNKGGASWHNKSAVYNCIALLWNQVALMLKFLELTSVLHLYITALGQVTHIQQVIYIYIKHTEIVQLNRIPLRTVQFITHRSIYF